MAAKLKSLQMWCKRQCEGYRDVEITNLTSSWKSGLAFCAIIHRYRPDLIDYDSLSKENVYENNKLAFDVAQEHLDIPALLDPEDMVAMAVPDKLCIVTYLSQYYNTFSKMEPAGGPGIKQCHAPSKRAAPSGGQPSAGPEAKKLTPTKQLLSDQNGLVRQAPSGNLQNGQKVAAPTRQGTYGDTCSICHHKVYLMERHIEDGQLYHRRCLRDKQKSVKSPTRPKQDSAVFQWPQSNAVQNKNKVTNLPQRNNFATAKKGSTVASDSQLRGPTLTSDSGSQVSDNCTPVKQSQSASSPSLVKLLYGAASPYPGSGNLENKVSETRKDTPMPASRIGKTGVVHKQVNVTNESVNKAKEKPLSIMERAAMFNADSKPRFGMSSGEQTPVSGGVTKTPVNASRMQTSSANSWSGKIDTVTYTYHTGGSTSVVNPTTPQTGSGGDVRSGLLQSLANIRRQRDEGDGSAAANQGSTAAAAPKTGVVDGKGTVSTFLGHRSALSHQSKEDGVVVSSNQRTSIGEALISQSADSKKSILKSSSPGHSYDGSCHKDVTPKTILKPRLNENNPSAVVEDQPKPILKSKRSSEEFSEFESGLVTNPRPILKSSSPTEPGQLLGSSPPKSILKSRETSPESGHKPAKSILKSKDSVDDMEVDEEGSTVESKPRSILKHSHDGGAHARDELVASPIRSILKHAASHPESKSILKSPVSPEIQKASIKNPEPSNDKAAGSLITTNNNQRKDDVPTASSRAQIKLAKDVLMPQPAPRKHLMEDAHKSSDTVLHRPAHPPSFDKVQSAAVADASSKRQPQPTPRSILKTSKDAVGTKSTASGSHWEKPIPEAAKSAGTPSMSSSMSSQSEDKANGPINNFNAFNLNDSLLIHGKNDNGSNKRTTTNGNHSAPKSAWQIELEARKRINTREVKGRAPPRPSAPPAGAERHASQTGTSLVNGDRYKSSALMRDMAVDSNKHQPSSDRQFSPGATHGLNVSGKQENGELGNKPVSSPPPRPPPPVHHGTPVPGHDGQNAMVQKTNTADVRHSPTNTKANLNRCPAFRIPDSPQSSPESKRNEAANSKSEKRGASSSGTGYPPAASSASPSPEMSSQNNKRKIVPDTRFSFRSGDFGSLDSSSPTLLPDATYFRFASHDDGFEHNDPGVSPSNQQGSPPKRRVNAEARVATLKIMHDLETLDKALQILEKEGRSLEEKIRSVSDDDMDEDSLMVEWFEMINKKNELVRKESELMYKKRQQELEDLHMDLEYELRLLMEKPENEKTASDRIRENTLIQELLETVNQRNHIVDSMEEDRKRYIAEDQEIADMMAKTGLVSGGAGKKKKNDKRKPQKKMDQNKESPKSKIKDSENNLDKVARKDRKHFKLSIG